MTLGRRSVHTFTETIPKYSYVPSVPLPRRVPLPTRPMPVSELRIPEHTAKFSVPSSIQSILPKSADTSRTMWSRHISSEEELARRSRRATTSATATAVAALTLSLALFYVRCTDPLHTESAHGLHASSNSQNDLMARRSAWHLVDQLQFVKDAAQLGPI